MNCMKIFCGTLEQQQWNVHSVLGWSLNTDFWNHMQYQILASQYGGRKPWTDVVLWGHKCNNFLGLPSNQAPIQWIFTHLIYPFQSLCKPLPAVTLILLYETSYWSVSCCLEGPIFSKNFLANFLWYIICRYSVQCYISCWFMMRYNSVTTVHWPEPVWDLWLIHQMRARTFITEDFKVFDLW
jgi:hypothetical protein